MGSANDFETRRRYADDTVLRIRQEVLDRYSVPSLNFPDWLVGRLRWNGDEHVLDVGSAWGLYYEPLRSRYPGLHYTGLDISPAILADHPARRHLTVGDAHELPFRNASFDVVMANNVMYQLPDIPQALKEFKRVLRPDGVVMTATSSVSTMPEFQALFRRAIMLLSASGKVYTQVTLPPHTAFALENGTRYLARTFPMVVRYDLPSTLVFPAIEPVMAYVESWRVTREPMLPREIHWDDVMVVMREQVNRVLNHFGELVVTQVTGVLIAGAVQNSVKAFVNKLKTSL